MTEDNAERIRELQIRIAQWERVHDHEIEEERDLQIDRRKSLALAMRVAIVGSIPSCVWLMCWVAVITASDSTLIHVVGSISAIVVFAIITAGAARASGLFAHWWFCRSPVHHRTRTVAVALAADLFLFWWVTVLARW